MKNIEKPAQSHTLMHTFWYLPDAALHTNIQFIWTHVEKKIIKTNELLNDRRLPHRSVSCNSIVWLGLSLSFNNSAGICSKMYLRMFYYFCFQLILSEALSSNCMCVCSLSRYCEPKNHNSDSHTATVLFHISYLHTLYCEFWTHNTKAVTHRWEIGVYFRRVFH